MQSTDYAELNHFFEQYVQRFKSNNPKTVKNIKVKYDHTTRVKNEIIVLAQSLGLPDEEIRLAGITGLFHDIGRFRQYVEFQTFKDSGSVDHGDLGVQVLQEQGVLGALNEEEQQVICTAVKFHNKKTFPSSLGEKETLFTKLVRDADKIDIYKVVTEHYHSKDNNKSIVLDLPDNDNINPLAFTSIKNQQLVDKHELITVNDFKLLQLSWIFDINFNKSLAIIVERGYLGLIHDSLPQTNEIEEVKEVITSFVNKRLSGEEVCNNKACY